MSSLILANSATTWAAIGALATLFTALVTLLLGFLYTSRQTEYARRAADNARTSAALARDATELAKQNLRLVASQLDVVKEQTQVLQRQVDLGLRSLRAQDRPAVGAGTLRREAGGYLTASVKNTGRGIAWLSRGWLVVGAKDDGFHIALRSAAEESTASVPMSCDPAVLSVGETGRLYTPREAVVADDTHAVWVVIPVSDFSGADNWTYFFGYWIDGSDALDRGVTVAGVHAAEGVCVGPDGVRWPRVDIDEAWVTPAG